MGGASATAPSLGHVIESLIVSLIYDGLVSRGHVAGKDLSSEKLLSMHNLFARTDAAKNPSLISLTCKYGLSGGEVTAHFLGRRNF